MQELRDGKLITGHWQRQQENYKNGGKFIPEFELQKQPTQLKLTDEFKWINNYSQQTIVQAIKMLAKLTKDF